MAVSTVRSVVPPAIAHEFDKLPVIRRSASSRHLPLSENNSDNIRLCTANASPVKLAQFTIINVIKKGFFNLVHHLLNMGIDPNYIDQKTVPHARSALMHVCLFVRDERWCLNLSRALVEHGASLSYRDARGLTVYHYACALGRHRLLGEVLLSALDFDFTLAVDKRGNTCLHYAVRARSLECVSLLVGKMRHSPHHFFARSLEETRNTYHLLAADLEWPQEEAAELDFFAGSASLEECKEVIRQLMRQKEEARRFAAMLLEAAAAARKKKAEMLLIAESISSSNHSKSSKSVSTAALKKKTGSKKAKKEKKEDDEQQLKHHDHFASEVSFKSAAVMMVESKPPYTATTATVEQSILCVSNKPTPTVASTVVMPVLGEARRTLLTAKSFVGLWPTKRELEPGQVVYRGIFEGKEHLLKCALLNKEAASSVLELPFSRSRRETRSTAAAAALTYPLASSRTQGTSALSNVDLQRRLRKNNEYDDDEEEDEPSTDWRKSVARFYRNMEYSMTPSFRKAARVRFHHHHPPPQDKNNNHEPADTFVVALTVAARLKLQQSYRRLQSQKSVEGSK